MSLRLPSEIEASKDAIETYKSEFIDFVKSISFGKEEKSGVVGCFLNEDVSNILERPLKKLIKKVTVSAADGWYDIFFEENAEAKDNISEKILSNVDFYKSASLMVSVEFTTEMEEYLKTRDDIVTYLNDVETLLNENKYIIKAVLDYSRMLIMIKSYEQLGERGKAKLLSKDVLEEQPIYKCCCPHAE